MLHKKKLKKKKKSVISNFNKLVQMGQIGNYGPLYKTSNGMVHSLSYLGVHIGATGLVASTWQVWSQCLVYSPWGLLMKRESNQFNKGTIFIEECVASNQIKPGNFKVIKN